MERKHIQFIFIFISGSLGENTDGDSGFHFIYCCQDGLKSLFNILSVQKQAVQITHPVRQKRDFFHFFFRNVSGADGTAGISQQDIEVASVIADIKYRSILRDIFLTDHSDFRSGNPQDKAEHKLNNAQGTDILRHRCELPDDPFYQKDRDRKDQKSDHHNTD